MNNDKDAENAIRKIALIRRLRDEVASNKFGNEFMPAGHGNILSAIVGR